MKTPNRQDRPDRLERLARRQRNAPLRDFLVVAALLIAPIVFLASGLNVADSHANAKDAITEVADAEFCETG